MEIKYSFDNYSIEFKSMMQNTNDYIYFKDRNHVFTGVSQSLVSLILNFLKIVKTLLARQITIYFLKSMRIFITV